MRRTTIPFWTTRSSAVAVVLALFLSSLTGLAQVPGKNVNMVAGTEWPEGDPFLQRQNEPSMAASTRNPLHLVGGSNDYRTVDVPGLADGEETDKENGDPVAYLGTSMVVESPGNVFLDKPWMAVDVQRGNNPRQCVAGGTTSRGRKPEGIPAGAVYVAWSERGFAALRPDPIEGDARILIATTTNGQTFSPPIVVDDDGQAGHQFMPSLTFAGGKLMLVYYDVRETAAQLFSRFINDADSTNGKRHTIDIRAALGTPGASPSFAPSVRVSDYLTGFRSGTSALEQLQINPPNLPMFKLGTVPFIGDYIDVTAAPAFVPLANGRWAYNTTASAEFPIFHATWTDNRDVRAPLDGNWTNYTPPTIEGQPRSASIGRQLRSIPTWVAPTRDWPLSTRISVEPTKPKRPTRKRWHVSTG